VNFKPILISQGDPRGIGPEIIAKCFARHPQAMRGCVVVGDVAVQRWGNAVAAGAANSLPVAPLGEDWCEGPDWPAGVPLLSLSEQSSQILQRQVADFSCEKPPVSLSQEALAGQMSAAWVRHAAQTVLRGDAAALVTAPIAKSAWNSAGLPFPGHTEMLQALAAAHAGCSIEHLPVRMMLANPELRVVLVSIHVPLALAIAALSTAAVLETLHIAHASLERSLGRKPRLAVAGLNPHAGEGGLLGREDMDIVAPAVQEARTRGLDVYGPIAPDTVFMRARNASRKPGEFDAVVALYHDQGLIPVKYLGVEDGVNITLGLPLVRTSPDHGTAFDIAGQGTADERSLLAAVLEAKKLVGWNLTISK
jgi:4-hydroxythreonine-4-phosphate dehydrogenase